MTNTVCRNTAFVCQTLLHPLQCETVEENITLYLTGAQILGAKIPVMSAWDLLELVIVAFAGVMRLCAFAGVMRLRNSGISALAGH